MAVGASGKWGSGLGRALRARGKRREVEEGADGWGRGVSDERGENGCGLGGLASAGSVGWSRLGCFGPVGCFFFFFVLNPFPFSFLFLFFPVLSFLV